MGNIMGGGKKRRAKVMTIDGSTVKVKPPAAARDVLRDHPPGYVLLDSDQVKQLGVRATPLPPDHPLNPGKLYFLVHLPDPPSTARRVRSAINVSAKERLEGLMLARRSASDVTFARSAPPRDAEGVDGGGGGTRVRVRLPRAQVAQLLQESGNSAEAAEKIVELCIGAAPSPSPAVSGPLREKKEVLRSLYWLRLASILRMLIQCWRSQYKID